MVISGEGWEKEIGSLAWTSTHCNINMLKGSTVWHREVCSALCGSLDGRGFVGRMDTCICMAESLCCPPEIITALLIGYAPIQNKKFKNKIK